MQNSKSIFLQSLKENKESPRLEFLICKDVEEIATKKLQRLKSDAYIQKRVRELFEIFYEALKEEDLINEKHVASVIDGLIKSASANETSLLFTRIYEKEQLEKWIDDQRLQIKNLIQLTYENLEEFIKDEVAKTALQDSKLRGIEMLGILKETTQEALLTTVEKGDDILDTVLEITKSISYQAINEGDFTKERFLDIAKAIVEVCIETADASQAFAKELLNGGVHGTKEGIVKAVEKFKNDLKFAPEEVEALLDRDLSETRKELIKIEDEYIQMLKNLSKKSSGVSKDILEEIIDEEFDTAFARIQRSSYEAREAITERLEELRKNASIFEKEFKEKASKRVEELKKEIGELEKRAGEKFESIRNSPKTKEAKMLGIRAWEVAKGIVSGAIQGARGAMKKDDN